MSLGYGASCKLVLSDENWYIYEYTSYNINLKNYKEAMENYDGIIILHKDFFQKPKIIRKKIKRPSGKKKWIEKKQYDELDWDTMFKDGKIVIENSSHCWDTSNGIDRYALKLLFYLEIKYTEEEIIPTEFGIFS